MSKQGWPSPHGGRLVIGLPRLPALRQPGGGGVGQHLRRDADHRLHQRDRAGRAAGAAGADARSGDHEHLLRRCRICAPRMSRCRAPDSWWRWTGRRPACGWPARHSRRGAGARHDDECEPTPSPSPGSGQRLRPPPWPPPDRARRHRRARRAYRTAGELVQALAERKVSSRELVDAAIARIEALDPKINAVVVRDFERARAAAGAADAALAQRRAPAAARPADDGQGAVQRRRPADHLGRSEIQGLAARGRRARGAAAQGRRRRHPRQDQRADRTWPTGRATTRSTAPPTIPGTGAHARRLVGRRGGGARGRLRAAGARLGYRRLAARAGAFLRRVLAQAEPRPGAAARLRAPRRPRRSRCAAIWR